MNPKKKFRRYELLEILRLDPRASIRELCDRMSVKAPSQMHGLLCELEQEGLIVRNRGKARSVYIVEDPPMIERQTSKGRDKQRKRRAATVREERIRLTRQSPERLARMIEEVVRQAQERETNIDVMHDYRHVFPRHCITARRIG